MQIKLGTRGSKLALWQADHVQQILESAGAKVTRQIVQTTGDLVQGKPLHQLGTTGIFTKALDIALREGEADIAVHSAKDMPSVLDDDLEIFSFLKREDPRDVLLSTSKEISLENATRNWVIGTSSMRRRAFLQHYSPHVNIKEIRGNVDTRIQKMENGEYDGIVLAYAGVKRMGLESYIVQKLNVSTFTPAVGQGVIAVVGRKNSPMKEFVKSILNDPSTEKALLAERSFLHTVAGGCSIPVFGLASIIGPTITLSAGLADEDGKNIFRHTEEGDVNHPVSLGIKVGESILKQSK